MTSSPSTGRYTRRACWALLCALIYGILALSAVVAQEKSGSQSSDAGSSHPEQQQAEKALDRPHFGRELAKESREAAGEDETAKFKQSASVQLVARLTGLSLQHAYWLSVLVNFAVVAGLIFWAARKYLPGAFRNRTAQIQKAMEDARQASGEANRRLADVEARLSRLDAEIASLRARADQDAASEDARIQAAAEEDARKIVQSAEQEIAAAAKAVRRELTIYTASLAVTMAAKRIQVDRATDEALVQDFAAQLAPVGNPRKGGL